MTKPLNKDLFRRHFNSQAKRLSTTLTDAACCRFRDSIKDFFEIATNKFSQIDPEGDQGFSEEQIDNAVKFLRGRGYTENFVVCLIKLANQNAADLTLAGAVPDPSA